MTTVFDITMEFQITKPVTNYLNLLYLGDAGGNHIPGFWINPDGKQLHWHDGSVSKDFDMGTALGALNTPRTIRFVQTASERKVILGDKEVVWAGKQDYSGARNIYFGDPRAQYASPAAGQVQARNIRITLGSMWTRMFIACDVHAPSTHLQRECAQPVYMSYLDPTTRMCLM